MNFSPYLIHLYINLFIIFFINSPFHLIHLPFSVWWTFHLAILSIWCWGLCISLCSFFCRLVHFHALSIVHIHLIHFPLTFLIFSSHHLFHCFTSSTFSNDLIQRFTSFILMFNIITNVSPRLGHFSICSLASNLIASSCSLFICWFPWWVLDCRASSQCSYIVWQFLGCSDGMIASDKVLQVVAVFGCGYWRSVLIWKECPCVLSPYPEVRHLCVPCFAHFSHPSMPQPVWHKLRYLNNAFSVPHRVLTVGINSLMETLDKPVVEKTPEEENEKMDHIFAQKSNGRPTRTFETKRVQSLKMWFEKNRKHPKFQTLEYYKTNKDGETFALGQYLYHYLKHIFFWNC